MPNLRDSDSIVDQLIAQRTRELVRNREEQILSRLKKLGIYFENEIQKAEFVKTRLTLITHQNNPQWKELYLDGQTLIASWWDTISLEGDKIIAGKHPNECEWFISK